MRAWSFTLHLEDKKLKTFVYSDTGKDIEERFKYKVTNIKEIDDPLAESKAEPKKKEKYV